MCREVMCKMSTSTGHRGPFATDEKHFTAHSGTWSLSSPTLPLRDAQLTTDDVECIPLRAPRYHERVNCTVASRVRVLAEAPFCYPNITLKAVREAEYYPRAVSDRLGDLSMRVGRTKIVIGRQVLRARERCASRWSGFARLAESVRQFTLELRRAPLSACAVTANAHAVFV